MQASVSRLRGCNRLVTAAAYTAFTTFQLLADQLTLGHRRRQLTHAITEHDRMSGRSTLDDLVANRIPHTERSTRPLRERHRFCPRGYQFVYLRTINPARLNNFVIRSSMVGQEGASRSPICYLGNGHRNLSVRFRWQVAVGCCKAPGRCA
jgi:hypothetical protein